MKPIEHHEEIRAKAKQRFREEAFDLDMDSTDIRRLVQELRIHQIELEIQNEELRQAQQRVTEIAEQYGDLYDFAPVGYLTLNKDSVIRRLNLTAAELLGTGRDRLINKPFIIRVPGDYHPRLNAHLRSVLAQNNLAAHCELEIQRPNGERLWVTVSSSLETAAKGEPLCRATLTDITKLKEAERALRENEEKYRLIADNTIDCIWQINLDLQFEYVNPAIYPMLGYTPDEWLGSRWCDHCPPHEMDHICRLIAGEISKGSAASKVTFEANMRHKDGRLIATEVTGKILFNPQHKAVGMQGVARDISERKRAEEEIRKFKMLAESASYGVLIADLAGIITYANAAFATMHGYRVDELLGSSLAALQADRHWDPSPMQMLDTESNSENYRDVYAKETVHRRKDGSEFNVLFNSTLVHDDVGALSFLAVTVTDITEFRSLQAQLQQAQKMEAIGQLAGGVAHDFNNLLMVIMNRAELMQDALPPFSTYREDIREIVDASMRGAQLTRQLLAFSRRQYLNMQPLDINAVITGIETMLKRLIGEDILLNMRLSEMPCTTLADAGQLEQVILNLAVNARDAMANGGMLTIETRFLSIRPEDISVTSESDRPMPGHYAVICVSDTGVGIDKGLQAHIFDPFFTTKDVGQGTGLGLSTVYGIIKQHNGFIRVYSEVNKGTTFRIFLPANDAQVHLDNSVTKSATLPRGRETVLLVEDEPAVRRISAKMLGDLGYEVLEAENGVKALESLQSLRGDVNVLLTDVLMPEMDGKQLVEQVTQIWPQIKIVFTSGYPEAHLKLRNAWIANHTLLQKPFIMAELASSIRRVLDRDSS
jgi:PAS domain S-box-containing protein